MDSYTQTAEPRNMAKAKIPPVDRPPMPPDEFCSLGAEIYGKMWKAALGRRLGFSWQHVHNLATGASPVSEPIRLALLLLKLKPKER